MTANTSSADAVPMPTMTAIQGGYQKSGASNPQTALPPAAKRREMGGWGYCFAALAYPRGLSASARAEWTRTAPLLITGEAA